MRGELIVLPGQRAPEGEARRRGDNGGWLSEGSKGEFQDRMLLSLGAGESAPSDEGEK